MKLISPTSTKNMTTLPLKESLAPATAGYAFLLIALTFACFALSPTARAVDPPPDGGYPNGNTAEGDGALASVTIGGNNTAVGFQALFNDTSGGFNNSGADGNTAIGFDALFSNKTGSGNTATGDFALYLNTGFYNTATGSQALNGNTTGGANTALGASAMGANKTGSFNTATGVAALFKNTSGNNNTASGYWALSGSGTNSFNTGNNNTANGFEALLSNTTGNGNSVNGSKGLFHNTTGSNNTANGSSALFLNSSGNGNIAEGRGALGNNTSGSFNTAVGFNAGANLTTGSNNIEIGAAGVAGESNTTRIGTVKQTATFITGIRGVMTANANAVPVVIDSAGQLGTVSSSRRFKDEIKPMENSSEAILELKPVTFHYKSDTRNTPQFGLVAEQVEKVNPDLVVRGEDGKVMTVRYEAVNAMLLNEFLKEHQKLEEQQATIERQQKQIDALTVGLQKVSARVESSNIAPRMVSDR